MRFRKKRGQVTLIIIVAFMIFIVFGFLMYARISLFKKNLEKEADRQIKEYIDRTSINMYITQCLSAVSDEIIIRAAMQGNFNFSNKTLYKDYITYNDSIYNRTINVSIGIKPNYECPIITHVIPEYPHNSTSLSNLNGIYNLNCRDNTFYSISDGFFGENTLMRLCHWNGSNKPIRINNVQTITCISGTYNYNSGDPNNIIYSLQEQMENEIDIEMQKCVNLTWLQERFPANITVNGTPKSRITFGVNEIQVFINYPFQINIRNEAPIIRMFEFSTRRDIHFKEMYNYMFTLVREDVSRYDFNKFTQNSLIPFFKNYEINRTQILTNESTYVDLIQIIDRNTSIQSKPLIFNFAIINRRPALDLIHKTQSNEYDILALENDTLTIVPEGYDPDEDLIAYNYSSWKEDYDANYTFNSSCTSASVNISVIRNCTQKIESIKPKNWSNSDEFKLTNKDAKIYLKRSDTGFHEVKVSIWDRGLLEDYQIVRILVIDYPIARINGSNIYNMSNNITSFEDPYILDGSGSYVSIGGLTEFKWNDSIENLTVIKQIVAGKTLFLPNESKYPQTISWDIVNITNYSFKRPDKNSPYYNSSIHNISLTVYSSIAGLFNTAIYPLNVTQCIPFRNNTNNKMFPYNTSNPFFANHTCCAESYLYNNESVVCFRTNEYGGNASFENLWNKSERVLPPNINTQSITYKNKTGQEISSFDITSNYSNDIFNRTFIRQCSGDRGNICSGNATETRQIVKECNDNNYGTTNPTNQIGRCEGPPINDNGKFISKEELSRATCQTYGQGTTFEYYLTSDNTFQNCGSQKCSDNNNYNRTGNWSCQGQCDGSGGCTNTINCVCDSSECDSSRECDDLRGNGNKGCGLRNPGIPDVCTECIISEDIGNNGRCSSYCGERYTICDNKLPKDPLENSRSGKYCSEQCLEQICQNNFAYNATGKVCYNRCVDNDQCKTGFICTNNQCQDQQQTG